MIVPLTLSDEALLALTIWAESRNQPLEGQIAVGQVILNRLKTGRWGTTLRRVILARAQFSCWASNGGLQNHQFLMRRVEQLTGNETIDFKELRHLDSTLAQAFWIAVGLLAGTVARDYSRGATHYLNPKVVLKVSGRLPKWTREPSTLVTVIADHDFYANVA
jgi:hypothetical protein